MNISSLFLSAVKNKNVVAALSAIFIILLIFIVPFVPVTVSQATTEKVPQNVLTNKVIQVPYNETKWVKVYNSPAVDPPVEKEVTPLLYHTKGVCTNRIPDYRPSSTTMEVYNLDSVPGNFTFYIGVEVKRNSDVESTPQSSGAKETPGTTIIKSPCYYDCDDENATPVPTSAKPSNIVLGEKQTQYIEPGKYAEFSYDVDFDIKQCIFREVSIPVKTVYKEIGVRTPSGVIEFWFENQTETVYKNETVVVNETHYEEIRTTRQISQRWTVWDYFTRPRTIASAPWINYTYPAGEK